MTDKLEKQFFDTFGIEPRSYLLCTSGWDCIDAQTCEQCYYGKLIEDEYPKITDHILLELIRLGLNYDFVIHTKSKDELKEKLLILLIHNDAEFKHQVQALFKENTNDR